MALEHRIDTALAKAVRIAGSQSAFGRLVGRPQSTVREWLKRELPAEFCRSVEAATGVPKEELRPDIFPPEEGEADNTPTPIRSDNHRGTDEAVSMDPLP